MTRIKSISSFVCCFLMAGAALAQAESDALPVDGPLYQAKLATETARLNAANDPLEKAGLYTAQASERLAEVEALSAENDHGYTTELVDQYEAAIENAEAQIEEAQVLGHDATAALTDVEQTTARHTEVLTALLDQVPEQAHDAILHAREVSQRGGNMARENLNRGRGNQQRNAGQGNSGRDDNAGQSNRNSSGGRAQ